MYWGDALFVFKINKGYKDCCSRSYKKRKCETTLPKSHKSFITAICEICSKLIRKTLERRH